MSGDIEKLTCNGWSNYVICVMLALSLIITDCLNDMQVRKLQQHIDQLQQQIDMKK